MSNRNNAIVAAKAMSNMNLLEAVIQICESTLLENRSYKTVERIVKICKKELQKELTIYDNALATLTEDTTK